MMQARGRSRAIGVALAWLVVSWSAIPGPELLSANQETACRAAAAVRIRHAKGQQGRGEAVAVSPDGIFVTNRHVIQDATVVRIRPFVTRKAEQQVFEVIGVYDDPHLEDFVRIQVDAGEEPIPFVEVSDVSVEELAGAELLVLGARNPGKKVKSKRIMCEPQNARVVTTHPSSGYLGRTVLLDSRTPPGMSGRAALLDGKLVGIATGGAQDSRGETDDVFTLVTRDAVEADAELVSLAEWNHPSDCGPRCRALQAFYRYRANCKGHNRKQLEAAIELDPTLGAAYVRLGICHLVAEKYTEGTALLEKGLELVADPSMLFLLARVYEDLGRYEKAAGAYGRALEIEPDFEDARLKLGWMYAELDRDDEALEQFLLLLEIQPHWESWLMDLLEAEQPGLAEAMKFLPETREHPGP